MPEAIVLDNGPEFRGRALAAWSEEPGVRLEFIQTGKPKMHERSLGDRLSNLHHVGTPRSRFSRMTSSKKMRPLRGRSKA